MPRTKADIYIGMRMREEVNRLFPTLSAASKAFCCDRKCFAAWSNGGTPESLHLARLYYLGGDVIYVLTGKRSNNGIQKT
jgi:hypothetical protein